MTSKHDAERIGSYCRLRSLYGAPASDSQRPRPRPRAGHADRLNRTGNAAYNQALSEKRVATVRDELVRLGVEPVRISTSARGDGTPVVDCSGRGLSGAALQECLLPNRRVDVQVRTNLR